MLLQTQREDSGTFSKIDAIATSQLLRGNTKGIFNQYPNATGVTYNLAKWLIQFIIPFTEYEFAVSNFSQILEGIRKEGFKLLLSKH